MPKHQLDPTRWIDSYSDYLFNYTITRIKNREMAKDLVQDTFVAALKAMKNFEGKSTERTWLVSILKRKIIDQYRRFNSKKGQAEVHIAYKSQEMDGEWIEEQISDLAAKNAEDAMENKELGEAIFECMQQLTPKQAQAFKLKTILNYDTEAVCNEMGITSSNLWVTIHRARTTLAECLEKNWF